MEDSKINDETERNMPRQTIIVKEQKNEINGIGLAGFVLVVVTVFLSWIPVFGWLFWLFFGWLLWLLGFIFSFIGMFKKPKGFAIAGLIISLVGIVLLLVIFAGFLGLAGLSSLAN